MDVCSHSSALTYTLTSMSVDFPSFQIDFSFFFPCTCNYVDLTFFGCLLLVIRRVLTSFLANDLYKYICVRELSRFIFALLSFIYIFTLETSYTEKYLYTCEKKARDFHGKFVKQANPITVTKRVKVIYTLVNSKAVFFSSLIKLYRFEFYRNKEWLMITHLQLVERVKRA